MNWIQIKDRVEYYRVGTETIPLMIRDFDKIAAVIDTAIAFDKIRGPGSRGAAGETYWKARAEHKKALEALDAP